MFRKLIGACVGLAMMGLLPSSAYALVFNLSSATDPTTFGFIEIDAELGGTWSLPGGLLDFDLTVDGVSIDSSTGAVTGSACCSFDVVTATAPIADVVAFTLSGPFPTPTAFLIFSNTEVGRLDMGCGGPPSGCVAAAGGTLVSDIAWSLQEAPEPSTLALFATGLALLAFLGWRRRGSVQVKAA